MKKAKERQITFYADPDVFEWLKKQESVTRYLNTAIRAAMTAEGGDAGSSTEGRRLSGMANNSAIKTVVTELEQIQEAIFKSYKRQQAMIGALRTHQKLFEKSATLYREFGRIRDEEVQIPEPEPHDFTVSSYNELLSNSADSIRAIIESTEQDQATLIAQNGIKERLIAAIESDGTSKRDVDAPARTFSLNMPSGTEQP
jgi:hypothetical protein